MGDEGWIRHRSIISFVVVRGGVGLMRGRYAHAKRRAHGVALRTEGTTPPNDPDTFLASRGLDAGWLDTQDAAPSQGELLLCDRAGLVELSNPASKSVRDCEISLVGEVK